MLMSRYAGIDSSHVSVLSLEVDRFNKESRPEQASPALSSHKLSWRISKESPGYFTSLCAKTVAFLDWRLLVIYDQPELQTLTHSNGHCYYINHQGEECRASLTCITLAESEMDIKSSITNISIPSHSHITHLASTETAIYMTSVEGLLFWCSDLQHISPEKVILSDRKVRRVSCGKEHVAILTTLGQVYTMGGGSRGQLGRGDIESCTEPHIVDTLSGMMISRVECGGWHTLALSDIGDVYSWGWNESGQTGLPCMKDRLNNNKHGCSHDGRSMITYPTLLFEDDTDIVVTKISCGVRHSAALTDSGELYTWGWNGYGQLFMSEDTVIQDTPYKVCPSAEEDKSYSNILCGGWSSIAFYDHH